MIKIKVTLRRFASFALLLSPVAAQAQILTSSTSNWHVMKYSGNGVEDPFNDQQTGQKESDIVGTSSVPSAYLIFDKGTSGSNTDGTLYFRIRMAADTQAAGYNGYMWIGIDANADGAVDIFMGANKQGSTSENVLRNPGTGANNSPNTTTISNTDLSSSPYVHTSSNYDWSIVGAANYAGSVLDVDADGNTDYFMSLAFPFQDVVTNLNTIGTGRPTAISITESTNLRFVIASSQQGNSINQDYMGGNIPVNSTTPFPLSDPIAPTGFALPEPGVLSLVSLGLIVLARRRRKEH
jgi:hypothetical protein